MNQGMTGDGRGVDAGAGRGAPTGGGGAIPRRWFLTGAAATAAALAAGCSGSDDGAKDGKGNTSTTRASQSTTTLHTAKLSGDPFALGVASGDPLTDAVILWTRLAPDPLKPETGGMPADPVDVIWELAADDRFAKLVASGVATAEPKYGHSLHVDATGLDPATDFHYRFRVGEWTSPVGRTRTLAEGSPKRFALAVANCQMFETGAYGAYRHMVDEDVDLVLHLGDYIYEYAAIPGDRSPAPAGIVTTLDDYRLRYASYKADPDLQAAHARFPFVCTWDDHDVANNYMGDVVPGTPDPTEALARKAAAYQVWWENLPVRLDPPTGPDVPIYRSATIGDLARLYVLDERQDAALPPCRPDPQDTTDFGDCAERTGEDRTRLGDAQERWLGDELARGGVTWNLLGNPVVLGGIDVGTTGPAFWLDTWDGFPQARQRLIDQLAGVDNPVVLTGDYHQGMVIDVHRTPFDQSTPVVAPEFMSPAISSLNFTQDASPRTPQLRQQMDIHGYLTVAATTEELTATFRAVADVGRADTDITTAATWKVTAGNPVAQKV
jgi:alkaline phosphatase D